MAKIELKPMRVGVMKFSIKGTSPFISHNWSEKAKKMMRDKHQGKKTKTRDARNPEEETEAAAYKTAKGEYGIPGMGFKKSLITAAHKDLGIEKTLVRKAIFLRTLDPEKVLPLTNQEPYIGREDMVRVGMGSADLRYRPMWEEWSVAIELEVDFDLLSESDVAALVDRAGFGVGLGEMRPEKNGEYGRFQIDKDQPWEVQAA